MTIRIPKSSDKFPELQDDYRLFKKDPLHSVIELLMLDCQISTRCLPLQSDTIMSQKAQFQASTVRLAARKGTICNVLVTTHTEEYQANSVSILEVVITVIYLHTHGTEPQLFVVYHVARQLSQVKGIFLCLSCRSACSLYNCRLCS